MLQSHLVGNVALSRPCVSPDFGGVDVDVFMDDVTLSQVDVQ